MKKHFLLLIALFVASMFVMAEMTIYVYKKDGKKIPYAAMEVDSIGFLESQASIPIDLGLSVKWASCNLGANFPEEVGDEYAVNRKVDVVSENLGGEWRTPTKEEASELINNCEMSSTSIYGIEGVTFTSKINGNSIFFPMTKNGKGVYITSTPNWTVDSDSYKPNYVLYLKPEVASTSTYVTSGFFRPVIP